MIDLAVIGSGPAALSAAIYAARAGLSVEVFEKGAVGGALPQIAYIENYPGFTGAGSDLAAILKQQALDCGARIRFGEARSILSPRPSRPSSRGSGANPRQQPPECANIDLLLQIDDELPIECRAVLVATGSEPRPLELDTKAPVSYCAICDGALYKGKNIAVIGGGNSAIQESLHLASLVGTITVYSHSALKAEPYLIDKLARLKNVTIKEKHDLTAAELDDYDGVFVFIGKRPATTFLPKEVLDKDGYVKTKDYQTTVSGLFAAGDVRKDSIKQVVTAAADGAAAALKIIDFLKTEHSR